MKKIITCICVFSFLLSLIVSQGTYAQTPTITLTGVQTVCAGKPISLTIGCPSAYNKPASITVLKGGSNLGVPAPPAISEAFSYIPASTGVSQLIWNATNGTGVYTFIPSCVSSGSVVSRLTSSISVTVVEPPSLSIATPVGCSGQPLSLTAVGCLGGSLKWSTGQTGSVISVSAVNSALAYLVTCTTPVGCVAVAKAVLVPPPMVSIVPNNLTVCTTEKVTLIARAEGAKTYRWSTGATTAAINVSATGAYSVQVTDSRGCSTSATSSITIKPPVSVTITPQSVTLCEGQTMVLTAMSSANITKYRWNTGATSSTILVGKTDTYAVSVADDGGCQATASTRVTVLPRLSLKASTTVVCAGQSVQLMAIGCERNQTLWSTGDTGNSIAVKPTSTTTYSVTCASGICVSGATASIAISAVAPPTPPTIAGSQTVCLGGAISLTATCSTGTAQWTSGARNGVLTATASRTGTITYMAVCAGGTLTCTGSTTVAVTVLPAPVLTASENLVVCIGTPLTLTANCNGGTVIWNNSTTANAITVNTSVTGVQSFTATCKNSAGCTAQLIRQVMVGRQVSFSLVNTATYPASTTSILGNLSETFTYIAPVLPAKVAIVGSVCGSGGEFGYSIRKIDGGAMPIVYMQKSTTVSVPGNATATIPPLGAGRYIATIQTPAGIRTINFTIAQAGSGRVATPETNTPTLAVQVSPNPVTDEALIQVDGAEGQRLQLILTDVQGRQLQEHIQENAPAQYVYKLKMTGHSVGSYILRASTPTQRNSVRILKVN